MAEGFGSTNDVWIRAAASDQAILRFMEGLGVNVNFIGDAGDIAVTIQSVLDCKKPMGLTAFFVNRMCRRRWRKHSTACFLFDLVSILNCAISLIM